MANGNKNKKIYISLPISGYDLNERRQTAEAAKERLVAAGYEPQNIMNPMANGLPAYAATTAHMKRDFEMLLQCDAILFLDRWNHSAGCLTELHVATAIGLDIFFEGCHAVDGCLKLK